MNILIKLILLLILTTNVSATGKSNSLIDSVWVWEITGSKRKVYLLGELHNIHGALDTRIAYNLGAKIIAQSSELWIEPQQLSINHPNDSKLISERLRPQTWEKIKNLVNLSVADILNHRPQSSIEKMSNDYLAALNTSQPMHANAEFDSLYFLKLRKIDPLNNLSHDGLTKYYEKNNQLKIAVQYLELPTSTAQAWYESCNDKDVEDIFTWSLTLQKNSDTKSFLAIQSAFLKKPSNLNNFDSVYKDNLGFRIQDKCSIKPRNRKWMPKIIDILDSEGDPASILFGIGHAYGESGLIELLKSAGYTKIRRIYKEEDL